MDSIKRRKDPTGFLITVVSSWEARASKSLSVLSISSPKASESDESMNWICLFVFDDWFVAASFYRIKISVIKYAYQKWYSITVMTDDDRSFVNILDDFVLLRLNLLWK